MAVFKKEKLCEPDYFEKNEKNQNVPFSDLIFLFFSRTLFFMMVFSLFEAAIFSRWFTTDTKKKWW